jgi:hypothetical protein
MERRTILCPCVWSINIVFHLFLLKLGNSEDNTYKALLLKVLQDFAEFLKKVGYDINTDAFIKQEIPFFSELKNEVKDEEEANVKIFLIFRIIIM